MLFDKRCMGPPCLFREIVISADKGRSTKKACVCSCVLQVESIIKKGTAKIKSALLLR